jgi:rod shape-determining protein MreC
VLIVLSQTGILGPVRGIAASPLNFLTGIMTRISTSLSTNTQGIEDIETLRRRNADLEEALARFQSELVELREIASDYQRLADLVNYSMASDDRTFIAADIIARSDPNAPLRTIVISRGTRDGLTVGMPVVTQLGLIGRILQVTANASRVLLVTDPSSAVSARLITSRAEGSVVGRLGGDMVMEFIPLNAEAQPGDIVTTSGLGGNFPSDVTIGQVTSVRQQEAELFQEAVVRSLIDFDTLEMVLVITSFQPVDLSVFEQNMDSTAGP